MWRPDPRAATYLVAALISVSLSYDLLRMPIQVSDSVIELVAVQKSPSVYATFVENIGTGAYMRPLRLAQIKALFDLAHGHYWLAYRGFQDVARLIEETVSRSVPWEPCGEIPVPW